MQPRTPGPGALGVVIPTLHEADTLPALLSDLEALPVPTEVVVSDGGSLDGTLDIAARAAVRTVRTGRGRASQMNAGAAVLETPWLLFLHADSRIPPETITALAGWMAAPHPSEAAHFVFRLDRTGPWWTLLELGQGVRERLTGLAYGDQGLLISRRRFRQVGGIPNLPVMEDVEMVRRLRRTGGLHRIDAPVITSARRYVREGPFRGWIRNAILIGLYGLGVPSHRLALWYRPREVRYPNHPSNVL